MYAGHLAAATFGAKSVEATTLNDGI